MSRLEVCLICVSLLLCVGLFCQSRQFFVSDISVSGLRFNKCAWTGSLSLSFVFFALCRSLLTNFPFYGPF